MSSGNRKMIAIGLVAVLIVAVVAVALAMSNPWGSGTDAATVTDATGTNVTMSKAPERIVSGAPDISEIVAALNLTDKLVAVTDYCDYPQGVADVRDAGNTIGGFFTPNYEKTISFAPDLVILNDGVQTQKDMATQLRGAGYTVLVVHAATDVETVYKNIEMIGKVVGKQSAAEDMVAGMKSQLSSIETKVSGEDKPNVMFVTYAEESFTNVYPAGGTTAIGEIINLAGADNVFQDMDGFQMASDEVLKSKAATTEVIIMTIMYSTETPENKSAWFSSDPIWKESPAVKNNKVYYLTGQAENIFNRESVRTINAVQLMAEIVHPDAFESKVPYSADSINKIGDEYLQYLPSGTAAQSSTVTMVAAMTRE
ncbi:MAG: ABC transporter substrate-binding protein [Methanomassiliicoccus sp.]|nr:ABC transporter substrate-binding protein [Methanomassiliicoccus sp.]